MFNAELFKGFIIGGIAALVVASPILITNKVWIVF